MKEEEIEQKIMDASELQLEDLSTMLDKKGFDFYPDTYKDNWTFTITDIVTTIARDLKRAFLKGVWQLYLRRKITQSDILSCLN